MSNLIRTDLFITKAQMAGIKRVAAKQGTSYAALVRRILDAFLGIQPEPVEPVKFKYEPRAARAAAK